MTWDNIWMIVRQILMIGGGFFVGKGWVSAENLTLIIGGIGSIGAALWALYAKWGTAAVSQTTASRVDVPVVSGALGTTSITKAP